MTTPPSLRQLASTGAAGVCLAFFPASAAAQDSPPAVDAWLAGQPQESFDLNALGAKLTTPAQAFNYVRDHIAYEPYGGVMKGAAGALLTHGANDFDRALLLASLLAAQGVEAKLAYGTLPAQAARGLLDDALKRPDAVGRMLETLPPASAPAPNESFDRRARRDAFTHGVADRRAEIRLAATAQELLLKPLAAALAVPEVAAPRRHVWVQALIDGRTVDLDPSRSDAKFGAAPTQVEGTWEPDGVPDDEFHAVVIRLVKETLAGGKLTRHELLTKDFRSTDLLTNGFRLVISPVGPPESAEDFQPVLMTTDDATPGETFRVSGEAPEPAESPGAGGLLGGFGGAAPESPAPVDPAKATQLARLWVEIVFHSPGLPDETDRRMIVDRVDRQPEGWKIVPALAADRSIRPLLVQVWDAGLDVGAPHPLAWIQAEAAALKTAGPWRAALTSGGEINPDDLPPPGLAPALPGFFLVSGLGRHRLAAAAGYRMQAFYLRPRLAFLRHGFVVSDWSKPGSVPARFAEGIDLVNQPLRCFGSADAGIFALRAGVIDTVLEQHALNHELPFNTVPLMAAAREQNVPLLVVSTAEQLERIEVPEAVRTALGDEIALGRVLLVPERLVAYAGTRTFGWWSTDARSGATVGRMDLGAGQAMMEYSNISDQMRKLSQEFGKLMGNMIRCYGGAIGAALGSDLPAPAKTESGGKKPAEASSEAALLQCLRDAACEALKDFYALAKSSFDENEEEGALEGIKETKDMINELDEALNEMAKGSEGGDDTFSKGCQLALGGGG